VKTKETIKENKKAKNIISKVDLTGIKASRTAMPNWAPATEPDVVGDTNLLRLICWKIRPEIEIPNPAKIIERVLGKRLVKKMV